MSNKFGTAIKVFGKKAIMKADKYSPEIYLGLGLFGMAGGVVLACKATYELRPEIEKFKATIEELDKNEEGLSKKERSKLARAAGMELAGCLLKKYGPSALVLGSSGYFLFRSYSKSKEQKTLLLEAYTGLQGVFSTYRSRAKERFGDEVDMELLTGAKKAKALIRENEEASVEEATEEDVHIISDEKKVADSPYGFWFDEWNSTQWQRNRHDAENFLMLQRAYFNNKLQAEGIVFLSDVLIALGFKRTKVSLHAGWRRDSAIGDGYISFGNLEPIFKETGEEVVTPTGKIQKVLSNWCYYLDFNCDGDVSDFI